MSQENVDVVLGCFRRYEVGDTKGFADLLDPNCEVTDPDGWPEPGPFLGRDEVIAQFERIAADFVEPRFDVHVVRTEGDWVIADYQWKVRGASSGLEADFDLTIACRVQSGRAVEGHLRWSHADALQAAGLSE